MYLNENWMNMKNYLSPESYEYLQINLSDKIDFKEKIMQLVTNIKNLQVNNFNDTHSFLEKMSEMKISMRGLFFLLYNILN